MALKGNLRDFSTTQLFNLIKLARKTGTLTIEAAKSKVSLIFKEGKLIYVTTNGQEDRLATTLLKAGKLSEEQARSLYAGGDIKNDKDLGVKLINAGLITQEDIVQSVRQRSLDAVYKLFNWPEGAFRFDPGLPSIEERIIIPIDLEAVIMEGSRRLKESALLEEELPDLGLALRFTDNPDARMRSINLTVEEWRAVSFINPRNSIRQIAQSNNMSEFQIRKIVYGLLQAGLVEMIRPEGVPYKPPKGAPSTPITARRPDVKRTVVHRLIDRIREL